MEKLKMETTYEQDFQKDAASLFMLDDSLVEQLTNGQTEGDQHKKDEEGKSKKGCCHKLFKRKKKEFSGFVFSLIMALGMLALLYVSIGMYLFDVVSDLLNAYNYYLNPNKIENNIAYFLLTLFCAVVPSLLMQFYSLRKEMRSLRKHRKKNTLKNNLHFFAFITAHVLQVGMPYRIARLLYFGRKSQTADDKERYRKKWIWEEITVTSMRAFETYLEAIPQLMLQLYIMITTLQAPPITMLACLGSVFGLSMSTRSFETLVEAEKDETPEETKSLSIVETVCYLIYQSCTILARVLSFALLLNIYVWAWVVLFLLHWFAVAKLFARNYVEMGVLTHIIYGFVCNFNFPIGFKLRGHEDCRGGLSLIYLLENIVMGVLWMDLRPGSSFGSSIDDSTTSVPLFTNSSTPIPPLSNSTTASPLELGVSEQTARGFLAFIAAVMLVSLLFTKIIVKLDRNQRNLDTTQLKLQFNKPKQPSTINAS